MSLTLRQICLVAEKLQPALDDLKGVLGIEDAVIRFVEATDGRGDGLGGIDIEVADSTELLKNADDRGLKVSDTQVMLCGVRFNLV